MQELRLTTAEVIGSIKSQYGGRICGQRTLGRVIDQMETEGRLTVQRMAAYRTVAESDVPVIADELIRTGRLEAEMATC
jgi:hypothetical protein